MNAAEHFSDHQTTLSELRAQMQRFVDERDWRQFHSPKNLSMSLAIEAAELMEHFQWISVEQSRDVRSQPEQLAEIADELADVACYLLSLCNELNVDLTTAVLAKLEKNRAKYPADKYRGRFQ